MMTPLVVGNVTWWSLAGAGRLLVGTGWPGIAPLAQEPTSDHVSQASVCDTDIVCLSQIIVKQT